MPSTLQTMIFRYNYKSNDVFFIHLIHFIKLFNGFKKFEIEMNSLGNYCINVLYCIELQRAYRDYKQREQCLIHTISKL